MARRAVMVAWVAFGLEAASAAAQFDVPRVVPCPPATLARCQANAFSSCIQRYERQTECETLFNDALDDYAAALPVVDTAPPDSFYDSDDVCEAVAETPPPLGPLGAPDFQSYGGIREYESGVIAVLGQRVIRALNRDRWEANGNALGSCQEYVYEKYYDLSVFEDAAAAAGEDARAVYGVAFGPRGAVASIGTRHLRGAALAGRDGTEFQTLTANALGSIVRTESKNAFFEHAEYFLPSLEALLVDFAYGYVPLDYAGGDLAYAGDELSEWTFGRLLENDTRSVHGFAWHQTMAAALAFGSRGAVERRRPALREDGTEVTRGYLDDELEALEALQDSWLEVVAAWQQMLREYRHLSDGVVECADGPYGAPLACEQTGSPPTGEEGAVLVRLNRTRNELLARAVALLNEADDHGCLEAGTTPCDWSPRRFARWIRGASSDLGWKRERDYRRCVEGAPNAGNFGGLTNLRLPAIPAFCATGTGEGYDAARRRPALSEYTCRSRAGARWYWAAPVLPRNAADTVAHLEAYLRDRPAYDEAAAAWDLEVRAGRLRLVPELLDPRTGRLAFPTSTRTGHDEMGKRQYIAAGYDWSVGWALEDGATICATRPSFDGHVDADVWLAGDRFSLVEMGASAELSRADAHARILGVNLFAPARVAGRERAGEPLFNVVLEGSLGDEASETFAFTVGPVPLVVTIGAAGQVGAATTLRAEATDLDGACVAATIGSRIRASITPYVSFDAFADAAIEAIVARVGVRGDLNLLDLSLPTSVDAAVAPGGVDALSETTFEITAESTLRMSTLDGKLRGYLRIGYCPFCDTWRKTIIKWDGPSFDGDLLRRDFAFNLYDLRETL